ncbi:MAG: DUF1007 family protein [Spirochaetales bacterium]|nr:DUF1007 family protein [Spirochaetales bacterium]
MRCVKILLFILFCSLPLAAHPHMLVYTQCTLDLDEGRTAGLWVEFEFDRFFSSEIVWSYDEDGNGVFDERETAELEEYVFSSFREYNYFTFIRVGKERFLPERTEDFSARLEDSSILFFRFYIPLEDFPHRDFYIALYDSSFFCACRLNQEDPALVRQEDFFRTSGSAVPDLTVTVESNEDYPVYYNPQGAATDKTTYDSWKPGLQTFIPEEIHVQFPN